MEKEIVSFTVSVVVNLVEFFAGKIDGAKAFADGFDEDAAAFDELNEKIYDFLDDRNTSEYETGAILYALSGASKETLLGCVNPAFDRGWIDAPAMKFEGSPNVVFTIPCEFDLAKFRTEQFATCERKS